MLFISTRLNLNNRKTPAFRSGSDTSTVRLDEKKTVWNFLDSSDLRINHRPLKPDSVSSLTELHKIYADLMI